jgi:hypothetical protein
MMALAWQLGGRAELVRITRYSGGLFLVQRL